LFWIELLENELKFNKCYDPGDVPESESLPVPETTTSPKPLVPVVDVVIVVVQLNSI
jgi:hypothetical protein